MVPLLGPNPGLLALLPQHPLPLPHLLCRPSPPRFHRAQELQIRRQVQAPAQGPSPFRRRRQMLHGRHAHVRLCRRPSPALLLPHRNGN